MKLILTAMTTMIAALASTACLKRPTSASTPKVIGGVEDYSSFPAAVGLLTIYEGNKFGTCTGTIVRDDLILTAAHCVAGGLSFVTYERPYSYEGIKKAKDAVVFPGYQKGLNPMDMVGQDVAFLIFDKGALAGRSMAKVSSTGAKQGEVVTLVGYGATDYNADSGSNPELKRFSGTNRIKGYDGPIIVLETAFVGMTDSGVSNGDSGGPLFDSKGEVVGIADVKFMQGTGENQLTNRDISKDNPDYSFYINVVDKGVAAFISAVMNDATPTAHTGNLVKQPVAAQP